MIRFIDAFTLAHTKLRTHRIRTGITVGVAGILFGLILAGIFIVQGVFDSVSRFSEEGLNDRALVLVSRMDDSFNVYQQLENKEFIAAVETRHAEIIAKKAAAAKKYNVPYDATTEDPSPIVIDDKTKVKSTDSNDIFSPAVEDVAAEYQKKAYKPFNIDGYLKQYSSARILPNNSRIQGEDGATFTYMKDGKEQALLSRRDAMSANMEDPALSIMNQSVSEPFINKLAQFNPEKGEIPVILPFDQAEKALGLKKLPGAATTQEKYERLQEVRSRIDEITASFCYRNIASQQLLSLAVNQRDEIEKNKDSAQYQTPSLIYKPIDQKSCGAVEIDKDTRSAFEKQQVEQYTAYQKETGSYPGEPVQYKVTVRAVGISGSAPGGASVSGVGDVVQSLLGSWLGYGEWIIPVGLLQQVPEKYRPADLFLIEENQKVERFGASVAFESYLVEFDDASEARAAMQRSGYGMGGGEVSTSPYGSGMLVIEDMKELFAKVVLWSLILIGGIAIIILGSMIGRTVSEGRRESSVFRAIGARRSDIGSIYGVYAFLLSIRVVLFAVVLGVVVALSVEILFWQEATLGARYAYAAADTAKEFHLFSVMSPYIPMIIGGILLVGVIASIIPIIRSARRNPIKDMRDDT